MLSLPRLFALLMFLGCSVTLAYSETGCLVPPAGSAGRSNVNMIYITPQPGEPPGKFYTTSPAYSLSCPAGSKSSTNYAGNVVDVSPSAGCWVEYKGGGTQYPNNYYQNGKRVNFQIYQCPIDGFTLSLFVVIAGIGFIGIKRMNQA